MIVIVIAPPPILSLTIWKGQHTDDQKEGDNHQNTNSEVVVRVLINPAILKTIEGLCSQRFAIELSMQLATC